MDFVVHLGAFDAASEDARLKGESSSDRGEGRTAVLAVVSAAERANLLLRANLRLDSCCCCKNVGSPQQQSPSSSSGCCCCCILSLCSAAFLRLRLPFLQAVFACCCLDEADDGVEEDRDEALNISWLDEEASLLL